MTVGAGVARTAAAVIAAGIGISVFGCLGLGEELCVLLFKQLARRVSDERPQIHGNRTKPNHGEEVDGKSSVGHAIFWE